MVTTNDFERDLENQAALKRPGRIDLRLFQNIPDAGDGHPGLQRCFRNYLHEGGMEKPIDLVGYGIIGTSVNIDNAELQQLSNIGTSVITTSIWSQLDNIEATTISAAQWIFVGEADQSVKQADSPTFNGLTLTSLTVNGSITITGNVDGVDVSDLYDAFDTHEGSTGANHTYIDQSVITTTSPTFIGLTLSADLVTTSTVDGVNVSTHVHSGAGQGGTVAHSSTGGRTVNDHHDQSHVLSGGDHTASGLTIGHVIRASGATTFAWTQLAHGDLSAIGSNAHTAIDSHLGSTVNHLTQDHGTYTGNSSADKLITVSTNFHLIIVVKTSATQKSWIKLEDLSDVNYDAIEIGVGDIETDRIETNGVGFRVWGECNTNGELYTWWGLKQ